jgi:thiamine pyrophosphate-dependent acetolactate synthase large subunit-like protein
MRAGLVQCHVEIMEAFGGKGFFVEDPKDLKGALAER